jgi:eukaryotic-like serine/threonine-protein kinase
MSRRTWIIIASVVVAVAVAAVAAVLVTSGGGVTVPDVTGKTQAEAAAALESAGFVVGDVTQVSDQGADTGVVLAQLPEGGSEAEKGSAVSLTVSSGPSTSAIPDVTGMSKGAAEAALTSAGFVPQSTYQYDAKVPEGQVMGQLPAAGTEAYPGSDVGLLVSKGLPDKVKVPDVTGLSEEAATNTLADVGLRAVPTEAYDEQVPKGSVADQDPAAATSVTPLTEVLIVVSLGQGTPAVAVPDVAGLTEAAATDELKAAGLTATVAEAYSTDVKAGLVMGQEPAAGVKVDEGASVGILVSLGAAPSPSPTPTPSTSPSPTAAPTGTPSGSASPSPLPPPSLPPIDITLPPDIAVELVEVPDLTGLTVDEATAQLTELGLQPVPLEVASETVQKGEVFGQLPLAGRRLPQTYPVLMLVSLGPPVQVNPLPAEESSGAPESSGSPEGAAFPQSSASP